MEREKLVRSDFPLARGEDGFDRASVSAHLEAVAAEVDALEARIAALEIERDAFRRQAGELPAGSRPGPFTRTGPPPAPGARVDVLPENGHRAGSRFGRVTRRESREDRPAQPQRPEPDPGEAGRTGSGDEVAARLAASALALEGADRETIRRQLDSRYQLSDPDGLLDDVLERLA